MEHEVSCFDFKMDIPYVVEDKRIKPAKDELLSNTQNIINEIETADSVFSAIRFAAEAVSYIEERIKKLLIRKYGRNFLFVGPEGEASLFDCCSPIMKRIEILTKLIENYKDKMILEEKQKIIEVLRDDM